jgi:hypothetical protein
MASAELLPDLTGQLDYKTWLDDVQDVLTAMDIEMGAWQENWEFDFRGQFDRGSTPHDAAHNAYDFWWQELIAESWT